MPIHRKQYDDQIHTPYYRVYADEAARLADTELELYHGKPRKALQQDDMTEWALVNTSPIEWVQITSSQGGFAYEVIEAGETLTIPAGRQMLLLEDITIEPGAELIVEGTLAFVK